MRCNSNSAAVRPFRKLVGDDYSYANCRYVGLSDEAMRQMRLGGGCSRQPRRDELAHTRHPRQATIIDGFIVTMQSSHARAQDKRVTELLRGVGLERHVANMYPQRVSGGMKQRVCIAIAISMGTQANHRR
jgi:ABC-type glutathione transport system ATPase component